MSIGSTEPNMGSDMNIFYLDHDAETAARMHCDKHCVKMILETAQLLSTAHRVLDGDRNANLWSLYKLTHKNHPSAQWVRESTANYRWAFTLLVELCEEYTRRYDKRHKTTRLIEALGYYPNNLPEGEFTQPPQCMPEPYHRSGDAVAAYREYYIQDKSHFAKWQYSPTPDWWPWSVSGALTYNDTSSQGEA